MTDGIGATGTSIGATGTSHPLSPAQQSIWVSQQLHPDSPVFNLSEYVEILGAIDIQLFEKALRLVVEQVDALHLRFLETDEGIRQEADPNVEWFMDFVDVSREPNPRHSAEVWMTEDIARVTNTFESPLFKYVLFRAAPDRYFWYVCYHHLVVDGFGGALIARRVAECYSTLASGQTPEDWKQSWIDVILKGEMEYRSSDKFKDDQKYWTERLADCPPPTTLAGKPPALASGFVRTTEYLAASDAAALAASARSAEVRLSAMLISATAIYLHRMTGQSELTLGIPVTARVGRDARRAAGMCSNILPLRLVIEPNAGLDSLLKQVSQELRALLRHQLYRTEDIRRDLGLRPNEPDPFGISVNIMPFDYDLRFDGYSSRVHNLSIGPVNDLSVAVFERQDGGDVRIDFVANPDNYTEEEVALHHSRFVNLLRRLAQASVDQPISEIDVLDSAERQTLLEGFNNTEKDLPSDQAVYQLFEARVRQTPDALALVFKDQSLTYGELNARANRLARHLRHHGVQAETLVGICVERSLEMVISVLGVLKSGGAYVPLDPQFPRERLAYMAEDAALGLVITSSHCADLAPDSAMQVILDSDELKISQLSSDNLNRIESPDHLAYVLYTSGSTGEPKGVEIPHRALTNFICAMRTEPGCTHRDVLLAVTTLSFDIAGLELFLPLIAGGRIQLASAEDVVDGRRLQGLLERSGATILQATPVTWRMLIASGWDGTAGLRALCGGEALAPDLAHQLLGKASSVWNMYGPTETTIWSSVHEVLPEDTEITVGRPIANTTLYVLDESLRPVPIGAPGELYIGGEGLARGYRGRPDLTSEGFVDNPFSDERPSRIYRTGDLVRYRSDGRVVHLGRLDHQVKLRGFRIELGEIETALGHHPGVLSNAVAVRVGPHGDAYLAAYLVPDTVQEVTPRELRGFLGRSLPDYMVPSVFVLLDALPQTPNGKIDRKRLPEPELEVSVDGAEYVAPRKPIEQSLVEMFEDLLGLERVGVRQDFLELGGTSLSAIRLISRISSEFKVDLPLQTLFNATTVEQLARLLESQMRISLHDSLDLFETPTERRLISIWKDMLGNRSIGMDESWMELQGESDLTEAMLTEVRRAFGVFAEGLPIQEFYAAPTLESLARLIDDALQPPSSTLLVDLQPAGTKTPLFLIHAGGGYVFFYRALATRLGPDRPVFGIRAETDTDQIGKPFVESETIEEVASRYVDQVQSVQPKGPYLLGGACVGGAIAYEMAQQLTRRGEEIAAPVLVFDGAIDNNGGLSADERLHLYRQLGIADEGHWKTQYHRRAAQLRRASQIRKLNGTWYLARKLATNAKSKMLSTSRSATRWAGALFSRLAKLTMQKLRLSPSQRTHDTTLKKSAAEPLGEKIAESPEQLQQMIMQRFLIESERLLREYTPAPFPGRVAVFNAAENGVDFGKTWKGLAEGGLVEFDMPGAHLDMMEEPLVANTSDLVVECLEKN